MNKVIAIRILLKYTGKFINRLIPKRHNYVYAEPHINGKADCFDLINCNADNCLKTLNYFLHNYKEKKVTLYIEVYDINRIPILNKYVESINNKQVTVKFITSCRANGIRTFNINKKAPSGDERYAHMNNIIKISLSRYFINTFIKYKCKIWVSDTGVANFYDKVKGQKLILFNYGVPFKRGGIYNKHFTYKHYDYICETSAMMSKITSSEYLVSENKFVNIGFSRNDTIGGSNKLKAVEKWLNEKGCKGKKIIVYVPTFRTHKIDYSEINVLGFRDDGELTKLLEKNNAVIVVKLHTIQSRWPSELPKNIINFEPTYDFTIYDMFCVTDLLISDYSSISTDFLLAHKPVIYNFSDYNEYDADRGFSFDPIQNVCCGDIVYNWNEMKVALDNCLNNKLIKDDIYKLKFRFWHEHDDFNACKRNYELLRELLDK